MKAIAVAVLIGLLAASSFCFAAGTNSAAADSGYTIHWDSVPLDQVLDVYASLCGRTVLVHPRVPGISVTLSIENQTRAEFRKAVEDAVEKEDIAFIPDGDAFQLIVPASDEKRCSALLASLSPLQADSAKRAYTFVYDRVDISQALDIYGALVGRKWIREMLPPASIRLKTVQPLTRAEAIHAFDVILAFNGLKAVNAGDDSFKVVSLSHSSR